MASRSRCADLDRSRAPPRDGLLDANVKRRLRSPTKDVARPFDCKNRNWNVDEAAFGSPNRQFDAQVRFDFSYDLTEVAALTAANVEYPLFTLIRSRQQQRIDYVIDVNVIPDCRSIAPNFELFVMERA
jgi:hypothetical protein